MKVVPSSPQERWRLLDELFHRALSYEGKARSAFLDEVCGSDPELRTDLESLLESASKVDGFLEDTVKKAAMEYLGTNTREITPGLCLDHYRILSALGAGGMGRVYLAEDLRLGRKVALKVLPGQLTRDEISLRRFEKEARVVSALNHPNLLTVFEFCDVDGLHFLVTEFIQGQTLRKLITERALDQSRAVDIALQVTGGLAAAHACGVIHRDIKPENVIVREDGVVKLLDFGIAKLSELTGDSVPTSNMSTVPGAIFGTPKYMSPEQVRGVRVDARTDIFSLGSVLYEMLSGTPPFHGETTSDILADVLRSDPPELTQIAPKCAKELSRIIKKSLEKNRDDRYQTSEELKRDLQQFKFLEERKQYARAAKGFTKRHRLVLAAYAALLLGVLAAVFAFWNRGPVVRVPFGHQSLAVLPFQNTDHDPQTEYLGFSLADAITSKLGYVNALTVRPSSAVTKYRDVTSEADLRKAAADLKVNLLLIGTYLRRNGRLEIAIRLVSEKPERVLWRNALFVNDDQLLTVQDRVTESIVGGLALQLSPAERARLRPDAPINSRAYECYLRGVDLYSIGNYRLAIAMLEQSAAAEPGYAPTWAHLGRAYTTNASLQFGGREGYHKAEQAYEKAIALSPELPEPRIYMANLFTDTGRVEGAIPLLRVALQSSPNNAEAHWELGYAYRFGGMLRESVVEGERARQLDPEVKINSSALNSYLYLGQYKKFLDSLPANDAPYLMFYRGLAQYYLHNLDFAQRAFDRAYDMEPNLLPTQVGKALSEGIRHRNAAGLHVLHEIEQRVDERGVSDAEAMYKVAQTYAVLGDPESALRMLQRSVEGGFFCYDYFSKDPLLDSLRTIPKFQQLLSQARERQQQFKQRFTRLRPEMEQTSN